jgi:hypothetical protein
MAAGEVRIAGTIEPAEVTLVSPLQSQPCVYYRASIRTDDELAGFGGAGGLEEERAVGFRVRDATGSVRVFPRGARWDAPRQLDDRDGTLGDRPPGLHLRTGSAVAQGQPDVEARIAELLRVAPTGEALVHPLLRDARSGRRRYQESRLAPGDEVTIVGRALPFSDLDDPAEADVAIGHGLAPDDPEVMGDLAEARAAGLLADDPEEAWGNAAIPGFGIGRPTREPELHPDATRPPIASAAVAERAAQTFHIPAHELVLASGPGMPLLIAHGQPSTAADRHQDRFVVGLLGAVLAIGSAMALAVVIGGGVAW